MRLIKKSVLIESIYYGIIAYPAPSNLSYFWNFGVYSLLCLVIQILTGIALAMHYAPEVGLAFYSVEHIMRDVNYGWLLRYIHSNGASMFFIVVTFIYFVAFIMDLIYTHVSIFGVWVLLSCYL